MADPSNPEVNHQLTVGKMIALHSDSDGDDRADHEGEASIQVDLFANDTDSLSLEVFFEVGSLVRRSTVYVPRSAALAIARFIHGLPFQGEGDI